VSASPPSPLPHTLRFPFCLCWSLWRV